MRDLEGRHALVTGASRGIGPHIARGLAREGAHVTVSARSSGALEEHVLALRARGARAVAVTADLRIASDRVRLVESATAGLGPIDILVNNAGIEYSGPFIELEPAAMGELAEVNVVAPQHLARLVLPGMVQRGRGHVVNIGSLAGKKSTPYDAAYAGTKAAIIEWSSALRIELRRTGVGVSSVCPGYVTGEGLFARFGVEPPPLLGSTTPERVARAVVRAIRRDKAEILVNSLPVRPFLALYAIWPGAFDRLLDITGVTAVQRRKLGLPARAR